MSSSSISPTELILSAISSNGIAIIIISLLAAAFLGIVLLICLCKSRGCNHQPKIGNIENPSDSTMNLIPPIFYTEDMRDPLYQEDLREKYRHRPSNDM